MNRLSRAFRGNDDRYSRTRNLHLAVILLAQGFSLVGLDRTDSQNHEFAFRKTFELEQTVERFKWHGQDAHANYRTCPALKEPSISFNCLVGHMDFWISPEAPKTLRS